MENNKRKPFLVINPIFDSEFSENKKEPKNVNRETIDSQDRKKFNISDKISIGFIE